MATVSPHNLNAESIFLGALLAHGMATGQVVGLLGAKDFDRANHGVIYRAVLALYREGRPRPTGYQAVADELAKAGMLERIGGRAYLQLLQAHAPGAERVEDYAWAVWNRAERRRRTAASGSNLGTLSQISPQGRAETRVLVCLARLLPTSERVRFVAEQRGNLSDCEHCWQRADQLAGLLIGMPRLAWMMWRDGRRGRV